MTRARYLVMVMMFGLAPVSGWGQTANPIAASAKAQFNLVSGFLVRTAEQVPDDFYGFRPTPDVRPAGEIFGHVADAFFSMCATADGTEPPRADVEKSVTGKAAMVAALRESIAFCAKVYDGMTDQRGTETVKFYFGPTPRVSVLYFNVSHGYEHYGNLVTYMRLKHLVPPSSEPRRPAQ